MSDGKIQTPESEYRAACVICRKVVPVMLYPHRLDGLMVGWVFVCFDDAEKVVGADVHIIKNRPVSLGPNPDA